MLDEFLRKIKPDQMPVRALSYQDLINIAFIADNGDIWGKLALWVEKKIALAREMNCQV